jgi:hypothetical protein
MSNLRYRYIVWVNKKLDHYDDIINDTPESMRYFKPQDEYTFGEQIIYGLIMPLFAVWSFGCQVNRFLIARTEGKLTVHASNENHPMQTEEKK